jgi:hypothetical protein
MKSKIIQSLIWSIVFSQPILLAMLAPAELWKTLIYVQATYWVMLAMCLYYIFMDGASQEERIRNLRKRCQKLFYGVDDWMYIMHPDLSYESPIGWIKSGKPIETVEKLLDHEEMHLK